jgi:hypothetical protein
VLAAIDVVNGTIDWVNNRFKRNIPKIPTIEAFIRVKIDFKIAATLKITSYHSKTPGIGGQAPKRQWGAGAKAGVGFEIAVGLTLGRPGSVFSVGGELAVKTEFGGIMAEAKISFGAGPVDLVGTCWFEYDLQRFVSPKETSDSQGWLSRLASAASNAAQNLTGLKLKDKKQLTGSWRVITERAEIFALNL